MRGKWKGLREGIFCGIWGGFEAGLRKAHRGCGTGFQGANPLDPFVGLVTRGGGKSLVILKYELFFTQADGI